MTHQGSDDPPRTGETVIIQIEYFDLSELSTHQESDNLPEGLRKLIYSPIIYIYPISHKLQLTRDWGEYLVSLGIWHMRSTYKQQQGWSVVHYSSPNNLICLQIKTFNEFDNSLTKKTTVRRRRKFWKSVL